MPSAARLCHDAVFLFCPHLDTRVMLCDATQHIPALSNIGNLIVDLDAIDSRILILSRKPLALHPIVGIIFISSH